MARFYCRLQGARGPTSRLGHNSICTSVQSHDGDIVVEMRRGEGKQGEGTDMVMIYCRSHDTGMAPTMLYRGTIAALVDMDSRQAMLHLLGVQTFTEAHDDMVLG